jgi:hypothetical protein
MSCRNRPPRTTTAARCPCVLGARQTQRRPIDALGLHIAVRADNHDRDIGVSGEAGGLPDRVVADRSLEADCVLSSRTAPSSSTVHGPTLVRSNWWGPLRSATSVADAMTRTGFSAPR